MKWEVIIHNPVWAKTAMISWQNFWFLHKQRLGFKDFVHTLIWAMVARSSLWLGVGHTFCAVLAHGFSGFWSPSLVALAFDTIFCTILCPLCLLSLCPPFLTSSPADILGGFHPEVFQFCMSEAYLYYSMSIAFTPEEVHEYSQNALRFVMSFTWIVWNDLYK